MSFSSILFCYKKIEKKIFSFLTALTVCGVCVLSPRPLGFSRDPRPLPTQSCAREAGGCVPCPRLSVAGWL